MPDNYDKSTWLTKNQRVTHCLPFGKQTDRHQDIFLKGGDPTVDLKGRTPFEHDTSNKETFTMPKLSLGV